jgi:hypothetical protein
VPSRGVEGRDPAGLESARSLWRSLYPLYPGLGSRCEGPRPAYSFNLGSLLRRAAIRLSPALCLIAVRGELGRGVRGDAHVQLLLRVVGMEFVRRFGGVARRPGELLSRESCWHLVVYQTQVWDIRGRQRVKEDRFRVDARRHGQDWPTHRSCGAVRRQLGERLGGGHCAREVGGLRAFRCWPDVASLGC